MVGEQLQGDVRNQWLEDTGVGHLDRRFTGRLEARLPGKPDDRCATCLDLVEVAQGLLAGRVVGEQGDDWRPVTDSPATYERNQEYLNRRRVQRLREQYNADELLEFLTAAAEREDSFAEAFGVDAPDEVAITAYASGAGRSVESVWEDLSTWKTIRRRIALLERALQPGANGTADQRPVA